MDTLDSRSQIEQHANQILKQHGLYSLPINPVVLADKLGVTVNNAQFADDSLAALLARRGQTTQIFVEQSATPYRKRFSIAHELGHHFLSHLPEDGEIVDQHADMFRDRHPSEKLPDQDRFKEIQANWFAAALLMPEELVRVAWEVNPNVYSLAKTCNVSEEAMGYRIDALEVWGTPSAA